MRFDDEHAYDQKIYDIPTIHEHLIPEQQFKKLIFAYVKKQGSVRGVYWLIDFVSALNEKEFPEARKQALKQIVLKIYTCFDDVLPLKQMIALLKALNKGPTEIAKTLGVSRNTVYYYIDQEAELPSQCMLTYGEYNLMLDFMDLWNEIKQMGEL